MVQEEGDCTVPLAVTASLSVFLLLLLLCVCSLLLYRHRRQASMHFCLTWIALGEIPPAPYTFPVQKLWLKYNEEDGRLHAVTRHCPKLAFTKGTQYIFWQRQNISCQHKAFLPQETAQTLAKCVTAGLEVWIPDKLGQIKQIWHYRDAPEQDISPEKIRGRKKHN